MITFLIYGFSAISGTPVPGSVYWLTSVVDGLALIPLLDLFFVPFAGRISREKVGRLHFLQAVAPLHTVVLVLTPWGYEFAPVKPTNEGNVAVLDGGMLVTLDEQEMTWYRLGNRRFGVTYVPSEEVLNERLATDDEIELETVQMEDEDGNTVVRELNVGGKGILSKKRGGFRGYTPFPSGVYEGFLVSLSRAVNSLRGGGDVRISERTEMSTRMEHGGGAHISNKTRAIAYLGTMFIAALVGVAIFGWLG